MTFLETEGLKMGYYHNVGNGEWYSQSEHFDLSDDVITNSATYSVSGDRFVAKSLKLKLYMHLPESEDTVPKFVALAETLLSASLGENISTNLEALIAESKNDQVTHGNKNISLSKEMWPNSIIGQYDLTLTIKVI